MRYINRELLFMGKTLFTGIIDEDAAKLEEYLRFGESYDLKKREIGEGERRALIYYIEGFQDGKIMAPLVSAIGSVVHNERGEVDGIFSLLPSLDMATVSSVEDAADNVTAGRAVVLSGLLGAEAKVVDARRYPLRSTSEPENDRVMRGSRDGFVEALLTNVTLIRRRIRSPELTVSYVRGGKITKTDIAIIYLHGKADPAFVERIVNKAENIKTDSLVLGHQSVTETLIKNKWYNPFPKIRATERPDAASAAILEGSVLILCDNSPEALIFPTSVFDFLQVTDDYYFPPLTGTYLRILRHVTFIMTVFLIPLWYLLLNHSEILPSWLQFIVPSKPGDLPIILQIFLAEFAIDGLKLASLNTPNMLSGSLSIVGGLLLGDFAVQVGWLSPDVILYMAFVAIANFTQTSFELGYAFKYLRMITLLLTVLFDVYGFIAGIIFAVILLLSNNTSASGRGYLFPVLPFGRKALARLLFRVKKHD